MELRSRLRSRKPVLIGASSFLVTASFYALGSGRALDYDSSESVGAFIATRSLLDPFRRQLQFNNHPFFSFLDHFVYTMGGQSAAALRALPITFGALTVGVVGFWATRRWGSAAGAAAASLLAVNPMFAELSRSVRGYSLLTLCAVVSTLLLMRLLDGAGRGLIFEYGAVVAIGIATHLYALLFVVGQIAVVAARQRIGRALVGVWVGALALGLSAYAGIAGGMLASGLRERGLFQPRFPVQAASAVLGSSSLAIGLLGALVVWGAVGVRRREPVVAFAAIAAALAFVWLSSPRDLYPRFLVWLVPGVALLVAAGVRRSRLALALAGVAIAVMVQTDTRYWKANPVPSIQAARTVIAATKDHDRPCVLPDIRGALMAYTTAPAEVSKPRQFSRCGIVLGTPFDPLHLRLAARDTFPYRWTLPAETPYIVYSRERRT